jgi:ribosome maturation factor RimP
MSKITEAVKDLAEAIVTKHGCELWNIDYVKEAGQWFLRVYIDHDDGVTIAQCEAISREIDPLLDEFEHLIPDKYTFEVSSAGTERLLSRPQDFEKFIGRLVEVKLYKARDGRKTFHGNLASYTDGNIELDTTDERHDFDKSIIASVRLKG